MNRQSQATLHLPVQVRQIALMMGLRVNQLRAFLDQFGAILGAMWFTNVHLSNVRHNAAGWQMLSTLSTWRTAAQLSTLVAAGVSRVK